jgi:hypothetical protein
VAGHAPRAEIDRAIAAGTSVRDIARQIHVNRSAVFRHRARVSDRVSEVAEVAEVARAVLKAETLDLIAEQRSTRPCAGPRAWHHRRPGRVFGCPGSRSRAPRNTHEAAQLAQHQAVADEVLGLCITSGIQVLDHYQAQDHFDGCGRPPRFSRMWSPPTQISFDSLKELIVLNDPVQLGQLWLPAQLKRWYQAEQVDGLNLKGQLVRTSRWLTSRTPFCSAN